METVEDGKMATTDFLRTIRNLYIESLTQLITHMVYPPKRDNDSEQQNYIQGLPKILRYLLQVSHALLYTGSWSVSLEHEPF